MKASAFWLLLLTLHPAFADDLTVTNANQLRRAVNEARPGTRILVAPGEYSGGFFFSKIHGESNRPIVIAAANPANPPIIKGGGNGIHLIDPAYVELHHLTVIGWTGNGVSIDDGGSFETPARGVVLRGLTVTNSGPKGNRDAIKLSGLTDFRVENCSVEGWGISGGSGIDMVGCHRGLIISNKFRHTDDTGSSGVQCKGGTSQVTIRQNHFQNAGGRAVNIGGSTGFTFFRPPLEPGAQHVEAKNIIVEQNSFIGSASPINFVGVDGAQVRFNTIYRPKRWAIRILQETTREDFIPSRKGEFTDNLVVFHSTEWSTGGVNIGGKTAPETFAFARNWWYCLDQPTRSKPQLPTPEIDGTYGKPVDFRNPETGDLHPSKNPIPVGAHAPLLK